MFFSLLQINYTGVGISEDHISKLFHRFYRVESKQARSHEGTGIGLALVKELINLHGGDVFVESKVDIGSTFRIWIPTGFEHLPPTQVDFGAAPPDKDIQMLNSIENDKNDECENTRYKFDRQLHLEESYQWIQDNQPDLENDSELNQCDSDDDAESNSDMIRFEDDDFDINDNNDNNEEDETQLQRPKKQKSRVLLVDDNTDMRYYHYFILFVLFF